MDRFDKMIAECFASALTPDGWGKVLQLAAERWWVKLDF